MNSLKQVNGELWDTYTDHIPNILSGNITLLLILRSNEK